MTNRHKSQVSSNTGSPDNSRRSFFLKLGAASAAVASAPLAVGAAPADIGDDALRVALLEEEQALRKLHQAFEQALDRGQYDDVVALFTRDAQVVFNGGVYMHRNQGISRLYRERFRVGKTGKRIEPAPGFEVAADRQQESVHVSVDTLSAEAVFPYSIQVGRPIETESSLAAMARLQGEGVQTWWEGGVYRVSYRRDAANGAWRISRLEYDTLSRADYRPGRTYATPITVTELSTRYPEDPQGPDALIRSS